MPKIAIIDIGSRSVNLEIHSIEGEGFKQIYYNTITTHLGQGISREGELDPEAVNRTKAVLAEYKKIIDGFDEVDKFKDFADPITVIVICTAAVRAARDREEFVAMAQQVLGEEAEVRVISGEEEAIYTFLGVINSTAMNEFVMIDTGGTSTEIALIKDRKLQRYASIPWGAVNITEKFFNSPVVPPHRFSEAVHTCLPQIEGLEWIAQCKNLPIIACGSSVRNLALAERHKKIAKSSSLHGYMINYSNVAFMVKQIGKMSAQARVDKLGIKKSNAETIIGGMVPLMALFRATGSRRMIVSEFGVMYGVFYEQYMRINKKVSAVEPDVLACSIRRILDRYNCDYSHADMVESLSLSMYEQTQKVHHLGDRFKNILSVAARLHDIGEYIGYHNHHEHSFYLINHSDVYGLEHQDKFYAAIAAGHHRKKKMHFDWVRYWRLISRRTLTDLKNLGEIIHIAEIIAEREPSATGVKLQIAPQTIQVMIEKPAKDRGEVAYGQSVGKLFGRKTYVV